ncbi:MAG: hypothetical protein OXF74_10505 [Rhodobacteraceae bacterium]|nr:hypothetical protein [Paracoccaceae bacterium]
MRTAAAPTDPAPATLEEAPAVPAEARAAFAGAQEALTGAEAEIADLRLRPGWFRRNVFGRRPEKRIDDLPLPQTGLFGAAGIDADQAVNGAGIRFSADVPVRTVRRRSFPTGSRAGLRACCEPACPAAGLL